MATYTPIQSIVLTSNSNSVTFSNIPQNFTDLILVTNAVATSACNTDIRFNGDSSTSYSWTYFSGTGSAVAASYTPNYSFIRLDSDGYSGTTYANINTAHINNYSNTTTYKPVIARGSNGSNGTALVEGTWLKTAAITSITFVNSYVAGSTFDLYGIGGTALGTPSALGGTSIAYDDLYVYHVFNCTGSFIPTRPLTADVLVVAGGGGAGQNQSGGGGAGGLLGFTSQNLTATSYTVTVGAGGAGNPSNTASNGGDSQFGAFTLVKGGGATGNATGYSGAGQAGGSGGGGSGGYPSGAGGAGGAASPAGQGYAGGAGGAWASGTISGSGGGGGAGAAGSVGTAGSTGAGGAGGIGSSSYSSWGLATGTGHLQSGTYYYAGGGGGAGGNNSSTPGTGGAGGYGGGGLGGTGQSVSGSGMAGTGGGGGGTSSKSSVGNGTPGNGGSGIVIVRYPR